MEDEVPDYIVIQKCDEFITNNGYSWSDRDKLIEITLNFFNLPEAQRIRILEREHKKCDEEDRKKQQIKE